MISGPMAPISMDNVIRWWEGEQIAVHAAHYPQPMPRADLGPNQLEWLRQNIPAFAKCEADVKASLAHALECNARIRQ